MIDIIEEWDVCDEHTQTFPRHQYCPYCRIEELEAQLQWDTGWCPECGARFQRSAELQRKHEALVQKGRHIIANYDEWDDVLPNECIDRLRALLEDDDGS